ncbi:MAG: hypothetical protein UU77_C0002G0023 [candidate division WWE3 bacterium GW2011_GWC1_41_7]|uniref:Nucleoid-associated protein n=4 Tax=Katanobacteria TaxID=422282 RepID=A0A0G0XBJ6_UNCKA|nr:MAG: hypothetical protein UU72_C0002G0046 [candidate division WWE3 bacterium GW2011_GWB1_41_6]KKS21472.1 MAG: hypothetical protein UU77_C0002G0023 [candidate division WWE3 bacterium GW2011_GWC1_41_7]KKS22275.1 MAG: hypothetical protein UU80_C0010G0029 [candidate division WWE3 bacterium GW2011_GWA1_41_8]OGC56616.1 MAG: hypothetical protein A2976_04375 [candidate division WWE3 bacterium RIFCSPLOWO2_01_FULL_41_9]
MFDKIKDLKRLKKMQDDLKKQLEQIYVQEEKGDYTVLIRGDKRVEKIIFEGEEDKALRDLINDAMKQVDKKVEKQMRGQMSEFGIPGL